MACPHMCGPTLFTECNRWECFTRTLGLVLWNTDFLKSFELWRAAEAKNKIWNLILIITQASATLMWRNSHFKNYRKMCWLLCRKSPFAKWKRISKTWTESSQASQMEYLELLTGVLIFLRNTLSYLRRKPLNDVNRL